MYLVVRGEVSEVSLLDSGRSGYIYIYIYVVISFAYVLEQAGLQQN